jgi:hypothetical protein
MSWLALRQTSDRLIQTNFHQGQQYETAKLNDLSKSGESAFQQKFGTRLAKKHNLKPKK